MKDAPIVGKSSPEEIIAYINKHITCAKPDPVTYPELSELVRTYQNHGRCTGSCRRVKTRRQGGFMSFCRYGFPRSTSSKTKLNASEKIVRNRQYGRRDKLYVLPRTEQETLINDYNSIIMLMWRGNMDIQVTFNIEMLL